MKHRFSAFLTALAAAAAMMLTAAADTPANGISCDTRGDTLAPGNAFTITLYCPPAENADTASIKVRFDSSAFEVTGWNVTLPGGISNHSEDGFSVSAANISREIDLSEGLTLTAGMAVKPDAAPGTYTVRLEESSLCYYDEEAFDYVELWHPEVLSAELTVTSGERSAVTTVITDAPVTENDAPAAAPSDGDKPGLTGIFILSGAAAVLIILCILAAKFGIARKK